MRVFARFFFENFPSTTGEPLYFIGGHAENRSKNESKKNSKNPFTTVDGTTAAGQEFIIINTFISEYLG